MDDEEDLELVPLFWMVDRTFSLPPATEPLVAPVDDDINGGISNGLLSMVAANN
jgi:hypothetical protein